MKRPNTVKRRTNQPIRITPTAIRKIEGNTPKTIRLPKSMNGCGRPVMVELLLVTRAAPLATLSMPRVTMKEGTFHCSTTKPLIAPHSEPTPMQPTSASGTETMNGKSLSVMISAPTTVQSASTDPTERSMPPVRMTKVMPEARTVLMAIWTKILRKFSALTK